MRINREKAPGRTTRRLKTRRGCDTNLARAEELVKLAKTGRAVADFKSAVADPQVDAVIVRPSIPRSPRFPPRPFARANTSSLKNRGHFRKAD